MMNSRNDHPKAGQRVVLAPAASVLLHVLLPRCYCMWLYVCHLCAIIVPLLRCCQACHIVDVHLMWVICVLHPPQLAAPPPPKKGLFHEGW